MTSDIESSVNTQMIKLENETTSDNNLSVNNTKLPQQNKLGEETTSRPVISRK